MPGRSSKKHRSSKCSSKHKCCIPCNKPANPTIFGAGTQNLTGGLTATIPTGICPATTTISFAGSSANTSGTITPVTNGLQIAIPSGLREAKINAGYSLVAATSDCDVGTTGTLNLVFTPTGGSPTVKASTPFTVGAAGEVVVPHTLANFTTTTPGTLSLTICTETGCTLLGPLSVVLDAIETASTSSTCFPFQSFPSCGCTF